MSQHEQDGTGDDEHAGGEQEQRPAGGAEGPQEQELSQRRARDRAREVQADEAGRSGHGEGTTGG